MTQLSDGKHSVARIELRPWVFGILLALVTWAYWNALAEAAVAWRGEQYSHGAFIPLGAAVLLWLRRLGGKSDWNPRSRKESRRLVVMVILIVAGGILYEVARRWAGAIPPSDLAGGILSSGLAFLASLVYALGLLLTAVFSADAWTERYRSASGQSRPQRGREVVFLDDAVPPKPGGREGEVGNGVGVSHVWPGLLLLTGAVFLRLCFAYVGLDSLAMMTFPLACFAACLVALGWHARRWCWPAAAILVFAFPLPFSVERAVLVPLQGVAASGGTYLLQTLGLEATNEGAHFIRLGDIQLGVVEQCSGLRMATVFLALVVFYLFVADVPTWQMPVLLLSAIPIAVLVNILRITVTGVLYVYVGAAWAQRVFHDWAGFLMPLVAVILLFALRWILDQLVIFEQEPEIPLAQRAAKPK